MSKFADQAIGLIETVGMVPAIYGADAMLKAADVDLIAYENVGSTLVTIMVRGDVAAVRASVEAGKAYASSIGKLTAHNVMPRPVRPVSDIARIYTVAEEPSEPRLQAIGLIETFGIVYVMEAADAMKTAHRYLSGHRESDGFQILADKHHLELSLEALAIQGRFTGLFSDEEANNALQRLLAAGYYG